MSVIFRKVSSAAKLIQNATASGKVSPHFVCLRRRLSRHCFRSNTTRVLILGFWCAQILRCSSGQTGKRRCSTSREGESGKRCQETPRKIPHLVLGTQAFRWVSLHKQPRESNSTVEETTSQAFSFFSECCGSKQSKLDNRFLENFSFRKKKLSSLLKFRSFNSFQNYFPSVGVRFLIKHQHFKTTSHRAQDVQRKQMKSLESCLA